MKVSKLIEKLQSLKEPDLEVMLSVEKAADWEDAETILSHVSVASNGRYVELKGIKE